MSTATVTIWDDETKEHYFVSTWIDFLDILKDIVTSENDHSIKDTYQDFVDEFNEEYEGEENTFEEIFDEWVNNLIDTFDQNILDVCNALELEVTAVRLPST